VHPAAAAQVEAQNAERDTQIYQATSAVTAREQANAATVLCRHARNATDIPGSSDLGRGGEWLLNGCDNCSYATHGGLNEQGGCTYSIKERVGWPSRLPHRAILEFHSWQPFFKRTLRLG